MQARRQRSPDRPADDAEEPARPRQRREAEIADQLRRAEGAVVIEAVRDPGEDDRRRQHGRQQPAPGARRARRVGGDVRAAQRRQQRERRQGLGRAAGADPEAVEARRGAGQLREPLPQLARAGGAAVPGDQAPRRGQPREDPRAEVARALEIDQVVAGCRRQQARLALLGGAGVASPSAALRKV